MLVAATLLKGLTALELCMAGPGPYDAMLADPRIIKSIEANIYVSGDFLPLLRYKIDELESGQTTAWGDMRHPEPFSDEELMAAALQKVALSLYVEVHDLVPWSILEYSDEDLELLLSDNYYTIEYLGSYLRQFRMFNANPLPAFAYVTELATLYPENPIERPEDALHLIITRMRDDGWLHISLGESWAEACADIGYLGFLDFECAAHAKLGSSGVTSHFWYAVAQAINIPSTKMTFIGHHGIGFPIIDLVLDGDVTYSRMKYVPPEQSFVDQELYDTWNALPYCDASGAWRRYTTLAYLGTYDDPEWNGNLLEAFCFAVHSPDFSYPGD